MRDINSLKENEAIQISTPVEKKRILKKAYKEGYSVRIIEDYAPSVFQIRKAQEDYLFWNHNFSNVSILPASDFIPKKKKKVNREWVEKYVAKALYAKQTQEAVERALQPSKEQISDLVTTDPANLDVRGAEVVGGLQEGEWYKSPEKNHNGLYFITKINGKFNNPHTSYGFTRCGEWDSSCNRDLHGFVPATKEEVEQALIEEAKRRGFKIGVKYKCAFTGSTQTVKKDFTYLSDTDNLIDRCGESVYRKGKWATIIESEKEIDWIIPRQLVVNNKGIVVMTHGRETGECFIGSYIPTSGKLYKNPSQGYWKKENFSLYTGEPITLSNEN